MLKQNQLLFIGGFPSGGTDLLKNIINSHPDIYINGEMPLLHRIGHLGYTSSSKISTHKEYLKLRDFLNINDEWNNIENLKFEPTNYPIDINTLLNNFFSKSKEHIWGNKTPQNTENYLILSKIFPDCKFIIISRDVRDIALSWKKKWGKNIYLCADKWNKRMENVSKEFENKQFLFIKYEDLLTDLKLTLEKVTKHLNIDFSENMLEYHKFTQNKIDGKINYGMKINKENSSKWNKYLNKKEIKRIEQIAYSSMKLYNYKIEYAHSKSRINLGYKILAQLYDIFSLIFTGNKASKQNNLKKRLQSLRYEIRKRF